MVATWSITLGFSLMVTINELELVWRKVITYLAILYEILASGGRITNRAMK
jgi:hypothetical protein